MTSEGRPKFSAAPGLPYEAARELAASIDPAVRRDLAQRADVPAEVLYFLADDHDPEVRSLVAANPATPPKAHLILSEDEDEAVRTALAGTIAEARPSRHATGRSAAITQQVLDRLTRDALTQVRAIIADALKDHPEADPVVINRLARDVEILVAAPVLQFSSVLTNSDLLDIISASPIRGALAAISRRSYVDICITDAIVATNDSQAITHMLRNASAQLQESTLDSLIERASGEPNWQEPLVYRPELNAHSAQRLAEVVAAHLLDRILARKDLSPEAVRAVAKVVGERLKDQSQEPAPAFTPTLELRFAPLLEKARAQHAKGQLGEVGLMVSLLTDAHDEVLAALSVRSQLSPSILQDIIAARSPRAMCALAWAAGYSPLFAVDLQQRLAGIPASLVMKPAPDGGFVLREKEMRWQLEMFGGD